MRRNKLFELSNHLGNVLVTVRDKKFGVSSDDSMVDYWVADVEVFVYANKYNTSELHNLKYNGKAIAQFTSFQDLKTVAHGRTPQEINEIGLQQE